MFHHLNHNHLVTLMIIIMIFIREDEDDKAHMHHHHHHHHYHHHHHHHHRNVTKRIWWVDDIDIGPTPRVCWHPKSNIPVRWGQPLAFTQNTFTFFQEQGLYHLLSPWSNRDKTRHRIWSKAFDNLHRRWWILTKDPIKWRKRLLRQKVEYTQKSRKFYP